MSIFIDIPYEEMKKAVVEAEKKKGICKILPHGRFTFDFVKDCGFNVKRVEEEDGQKIRFQLLVCEALGGKSTGCSADVCRNCVVRVCKHKHTVLQKCKAKECSEYGKNHIFCKDCKTLIDILRDREKAFKQLKKYNKKVIK